jgi:P-type E1-E2 ATPase
MLEGIMIEVPGSTALLIHTLALDFTGTLSLDGRLLDGVVDRLQSLSRIIRIIVLTSDTFDTAHDALGEMPVEVIIVNSGQEKADFTAGLDASHVAAIGNGMNDVPMLSDAVLSIAVIGPEGCAAKAILAADVITRDIVEALDLLICPRRLKATLRL